MQNQENQNQSKKTSNFQKSFLGMVANSLVTTTLGNVFITGQIYAATNQELYYPGDPHWTLSGANLSLKLWGANAFFRGFSLYFTYNLIRSGMQKYIQEKVKVKEVPLEERNSRVCAKMFGLKMASKSLTNLQVMPVLGLMVLYTTDTINRFSGIGDLIQQIKLDKNLWKSLFVSWKVVLTGCFLNSVLDTLSFKFDYIDDDKKNISKQGPFFIKHVLTILIVESIFGLTCNSVVRTASGGAAYGLKEYLANPLSFIVNEFSLIGITFSWLSLGFSLLKAN